MDSEPLHSSNGVQDDLLLSNLFDLTSIYHMAHQLGCTSIVGRQVLSVLNSASQISQLLHISCHLILPLSLHLLLIFNLILGSSPFRAHLEHIRSNTL